MSDLLKYLKSLLIRCSLWDVVSAVDTLRLETTIKMLNIPHFNAKMNALKEVCPVQNYPCKAFVTDAVEIDFLLGTTWVFYAYKFNCRIYLVLLGHVEVNVWALNEGVNACISLILEAFLDFSAVKELKASAVRMEHDNIIFVSLLTGCAAHRRAPTGGK